MPELPGITDTQAPYGLTPSASGSGGGVSGASPAASASANVAAIQSALNSGGLVSLTTPGVYQVNSTLVIPSNTDIRLGAGVTVQLAPNANCLMLRNSNWGAAAIAVTSLASADGITVTGTTTAPHGYTVASSDWLFIAGATQETYNGVWFVTFTGASTFTYKVAIKAPSETLTTPATGTITCYPANGNIRVSGDGAWDYNSAAQSTPDTYQRHAIYLRRVGNLKITNTRLLNVMKYAFHIANFQNVLIDDVYFDTLSDCIHLGGSGKHVVARGLKGKGGDDFFAVTQGDYPQYADPGYIIGNFDDLNADLSGFDGGWDSVKLMPQGGYSWGTTTIRNVHGRFSGGAAQITAGYDSGMVKQDGATPCTAGTMNVLKIDGIDSQQSSAKPIVLIGTPVNTLSIERFTALLGTTAGSSVGVLVSATGSIGTLEGSNWTIKGGSASAQAILVNGSGTIGDVIVNNFLFDTLGAAIALNPSSLPNGSLMFSNGRAKAMSTFLTTGVRAVGNVAIPILCSNVRYTAPVGAFFTGTSASAQIAASLSNCDIPSAAEFGGTWLNRIADWTPEHRDVITYAATITPDHSLGSLKACTFTGNMTINAPSSVFASNGQDGKQITFLLIRNAATAAITWNAAYKFPVAFTDSSVTTTRTAVTFRYDGNGSWICVSGANAWN